MEFSINRNEILVPLQTVCNVVERKQSLPILSNVLIIAEKKQLVFTGTDSEIEIVTHLDHNIQKSNKTTVSARKLLDICKSFPDNSKLGFSLRDNKLVIISGKSRFTLLTLPADEFPSTETLPDCISVLLTHSDFRGLLEYTMFSMAKNDVRHYLNGLLLELQNDSVKAIATDGHRLAIEEVKVKTGVSESRQILIPRKAVTELMKLLDDSDKSIDIQVNNHHIRVTSGNVQFTSSLIDGKFPDYQKVIPERSDNVAEVNNESFQQCLRRASILSNEKYRGIRLSLASGSMKIFANNPEAEEAEEEIDVNYSGKEMEIGFNANYLLDALHAIKTKQVILDISDPSSSCLVLPNNNEQCKYVIMPMRL